MKTRIDSKHHIEAVCLDDPGHMATGRIIKSTNGQPIPDGEPTILFRGRDKLAVKVLEYYRDLCMADGCTTYQMESMSTMIDEFKKFSTLSPTMKQPGCTNGA